MEEQPHEKPPASSGKPGIFQNVNGVIAGITGLVIAIGGLVATWDKIFPSKAAEPQPVVAASPLASGPAAAEADADAEPEAGDPTSYKGELVDGGRLVTIEWDGENWIVTESGNDPWSYDETLSPEESRVLAVSNGNYLRWPIKGGEVDESEDKIKWKTYARIEVVEP